MTDITPAVIKAALRLAIEALRDYRRRHFAIGHNAFVRGQVFTFSERDHQSYERYSKAVNVLTDLLKDLGWVQAKKKIQIKGLTAAQNAWLNSYEGSTGFQPMHLDDIESGAMTFDEAARNNIAWYEQHKNDAFASITDRVPYDNQ